MTRDRRIVRLAVAELDKACHAVFCVRGRRDLVRRTERVASPAGRDGEAGTPKS
jgi:hypothetical protein